MYDRIKNNEKYRAKKKVVIETNKKGLLTVFNFIDEEDAIYITAPKAEHLTVPVSKEKIAEALSISEDDISTQYPIDIIDAGLRTLIVPLDSLDTEVSTFPSQLRLKDFCVDNGIDIILIFSKMVSQPQYIAHTRVFAPRFGYLEDPATGSGNSAFANYMIKNKLWDGSSAAVEQGGNRFSYNTVKLKTEGDKVLFGGKATVRIEGKYFI
jgi:PhzF family phenazine biosynthesis protein